MLQLIVTISIVVLGAATIAAMIPPGAAWFRRYRKRPNLAHPSSFALQQLTHIAMVLHSSFVILMLLGYHPLDFLPYSPGRSFMGEIAYGLVAVAGLVLFAAGNFLRVWAAYAMGNVFDKDVLIKKNHTLVKNGPYRWTRHPMYAGNLLAELGLGLAVASWPLILFTIIVSFPLNNYRAAAEERLLETYFGEEYRRLRDRAGRWLP
jgi:protein-S-isoprenylcysteine O-methyltransferase Ste14